MNLSSLVTEIESIDSSLVKRATSAVNIALTARNWTVGAYLVEFEQNGEDRAEYGQKLIPELAKQLKKLKIRGLNTTALKQCRTFYMSYPSIGQTLPDQFPNLINDNSLQIRQTVSDEFKNKTKPIDIEVPPQKIITQLSFSHIIELLKIDDLSEL